MATLKPDGLDVWRRLVTTILSELSINNNQLFSRMILDHLQDV